MKDIAEVWSISQRRVSRYRNFAVAVSQKVESSRNVSIQRLSRQGGNQGSSSISDQEVEGGEALSFLDAGSTETDLETVGSSKYARSYCDP